MPSVALAITLSIVNLVFAANVYLSLRGWLVPYEPSGMQLLFHFVLTAPVVIGTTTWLFILSKNRKCSGALWKANLVGLLIPVISSQTGITYHGYDKLGLLVICFLTPVLIVLFIRDMRQVAPS